MGSRAIFKNPLTSAPLWHVVDATGHHVGKLASKIAGLLRGKHKPIFDNSATRLCGDYVVVLNAHRIEFTGKKWDQKLYRKHSGYPGGLKETKAKEMREKNPEHIIRHAVMGMLPKNNNRYYLGQKLKIYDGIFNPHNGQISQVPSSSLALNIGPFVEPNFDPTPEQLTEYFAGYRVDVDDNEESFSMVETKVRSHKEKLKTERRLLRKKRIGELKPINLPSTTTSQDSVDS
ncbi:50S ribosomal protein L13 [Heterostelium album PN500]|uniref:50S ribosomal protein L13 n=1 Tax=Heterostelium pallidum (strain ATCC 26659 / Pp 5 / PN500) TaxID=670386 RepID=D3B416_HETP5|nr:50S ribosomal protein L13 [Heterostelium album PN500]EFA84064.1 50S ribosomal protein L13 [Heterostelium album PN500]|eukprot:XP_020436181.1 50S ribosomal protein L13 [Heterostelium album PN500]